MNQGEQVSEKNQNNIDFSKNGFHFYDTPLIEYIWLKDVILSHLQAINTSEIKSVSVNLDSTGNITDAEISEHLIENNGNTVINQELEFSVRDDKDGVIVYDSSSFVMPNYSAEN